MDSASTHYFVQGTALPSLPTIPRSIAVSSEYSAPYSLDQKSGPGMSETHSAETMQFENSITREDGQYLRNQTLERAARSKSPDFLPVKSKRELHPQQAAIKIAPDENPLSPKFLGNTLSHNLDIDAASGSAIDNHLPGQATHANQHIRGGTWKYGLCDCGDIGVCCTGVWCPCILYGKTQYRLTQRSERRDPTNMLGYSMFNGSCAAYAVLCGCNLILAAIQHSRLRKTYDIPGGVGTDFANACCCCCCTLSQDEKEIKFRETRARRTSGAGGLTPYMSPQSMNFSAAPN
jgi:Cys-rich protein (TIGR01571 family)